MAEESIKLALFEQAILPHLDSAYNLARWIMENDQDAEDMVQEACLRAYKYFSGFQGGSGRAWLLAIVRNTCYTWLQQNREQMHLVELDEELSADTAENPEIFLEEDIDHEMVRRALEQIPVEFRELIILREWEGLSYKEISHIAGLPIGTVMSRLSRARQKLKECLERKEEDDAHGS